MDYTAYKTYFEDLCRDHVALNHGDALGEKVFAMVTQTEAMGAYRSEVDTDGYLFRLIEPQWGLGTPSKEVLAGFTIAKRLSMRDGLTDVLREMDEIGYQFALRMVEDCNAGHPLFHYSIRELEQLSFKAMPKPVMGDGYLGRLFTFRFQTFLDYSPEKTTKCWKSKSKNP
jgi:hypothetical protein